MPANGDHYPAQAPTIVEPALDLVRIETTCRPITVIGDPSIATVQAIGPHRLSTEPGTALIAAAEPRSRFLLSKATRVLIGRPSAEGFYRSRRIGLPGRRSTVPFEPLTVRVHPQTAVEVAARKTTLDVMAMDGPVVVRLRGATARIHDARGPLDIDLVGGSAEVRGPLGQADSHIRCTAGTVSIDLTDPSPVLLVASSRATRWGPLANLLLTTRELPGGLRVLAPYMQTPNGLVIRPSKTSVETRRTITLQLRGASCTVR